jgi:predicted nucleic acid-binding protein
MRCTGLVFDTSCLSHFAIADRIDVLGYMLDGTRCHTTSVVLEEIRNGMPERPRLKRVFEQDWIQEERIDASIGRLADFVESADRLGSNHGRDLGESSVLAVAAEFGFTAVIDDRQAGTVASYHHEHVHGTLWLLAEAWRIRRATKVQVCSLVDALRESGMRLPCVGNQFPEFAKKNRLGPWAAR